MRHLNSWLAIVPISSDIKALVIFTAFYSNCRPFYNNQIKDARGTCHLGDIFI